MFRILCSVVIFVFLAACSRPEDARIQRSVSAPEIVDAYVPVTDGVGEIRASGVKICQGFFSSAQEVTTPYHCILAHMLTELSFVSERGTHFEFDRIARTQENGDMAILQTRTANSSPQPTSAVSGTTAAATRRQVPSDARVQMIRGDLILLRPGIYTHTFNTVSGNSGTPIYQHGNVVAVHIGFSRTLSRNIALQSKNVQDVSLDDLDIEEEISMKEVKGRLRPPRGGCGHSINDCFPNHKNERDQARADADRLAAENGALKEKIAELNQRFENLPGKEKAVDEGKARALTDAYKDAIQCLSSTGDLDRCWGGFHQRFCDTVGC